MAINFIPALNPLTMLTAPNAANNTPNIQADTGNKAANGAAKAGSDFGQFLSDALNQVDNLQKEADAASVGLATGQIQDVHTVMIALQKANLALSLTVETRNKLIDAYSEIMRMQI